MALPRKMKAVLKTKRCPGLELRIVPVPRPKPDEVLIQVEATSICGTDLHIFEWDGWAQKNVKPPLVIGHECAGKVVGWGKNVTGFRKGDRISVETHISCNQCFQCRTGNLHVCEKMKIFGVHTNGVWAEYAVVPSKNAWKNPLGLKPEHATVQEPLGNAVHSVFEGNDAIAGSSVLVLGCGPIGLFCIQLAQAAGAVQVFASDTSPYRLRMAKKMGAKTFNARGKDFVPEIVRATGGRGVDIVLEMSGSPAALRSGLKALRIGGRVSLLGIFPGEVSLDLSRDVVFKEAKLFGIVGRKMFETWHLARSLLESKKVNPAAVITHRFRLEEFEKGLELMKRGECGKVVLFP